MMQFGYVLDKRMKLRRIPFCHMQQRKGKENMQFQIQIVQDTKQETAVIIKLKLVEFIKHPVWANQHIFDQFQFKVS